MDQVALSMDARRIIEIFIPLADAPDSPDKPTRLIETADAMPCRINDGHGPVFMNEKRVIVREKRTDGKPVGVDFKQIPHADHIGR